MKRPRPYIPLSVRVKVAERQVSPFAGAIWDIYEATEPWTLGRRLSILLRYLYPDGDYQLDHDPALILRKFNVRTGKYTPAANNPDFLFYRRKDLHLQKTTGRKPGAERTITTKGSDIGVKTKFAKLERPRRQKQKIPARKNPWPKRSMRA